MNAAVCMDTRVIIYGACLFTYVYFFFLYDIYLCNPLSVWEAGSSNAWMSVVFGGEHVWVDVFLCDHVCGCYAWYDIDMFTRV